MLDLLSLWENVLLEVAKHIPKSKMMAGFLHSALFDIHNKKATIASARNFYVSYIEKSKPQILEAFASLSVPVESIEVVVDGSLENEKKNQAVDLVLLLKDSKTISEDTDDTVQTRKLPKQASVKITKEGETYISKILDDAFTLRNFVVGNENQLAHAACQAVANSPGGAYNPLFIYGSVGLGKTHLLQATANEILRKNPNALVVYLPAENFIAEVVDAIQKRKMEYVRKKYRQVDVFVLDDIQFLAGKDRTQEIFFHLFNDLYSGKKQMIFSSDRPPMELQLTEDRLKSRFSMGMIADVKFPGYETRLAIVKLKAREAGILMEDSVHDFIAQNVHHSIRELQGVILQSKAQQDLCGVEPTIEYLEEVFQKLNKGQKIIKTFTKGTLPKTMDDVLESIADHYSLPLKDILGTSRSSQFMEARQVAMYCIKKYLKVSLQQIGEYFSGRDHTSVLHATRKIEKKIKEEPEFWKEIHDIFE